MNAKHTKYPQLRFKGFIDPWEQRRLSDGMTEYTDRVYIDNQTVYRQVSVKNVGEICLRGSQLGKNIGRKRQAKINLQEHPITLVFTRQTVEQGGIGFAPEETDGAIVTENMPTIDVDTRVFAPSFLSALFKSGEFRVSAILPNITGGTAQIAIHEDDLLDSLLVVPEIEEQSVIGRLFTIIDQAIALHQRKLAKLKELKQGYLQKLFPKNGSKFPQLRFAGFADAWEQRKFNWMLDPEDGIRRGPFGSALKKSLFVADSPYAVYEQQNAIYDRFNTRYCISEQTFNKLRKFELHSGDFIMSGAGTIGRISRVPEGIKAGVFNQALIRFRVDSKKVSPKYFLQLIRSPQMQKRLTESNPGSAITNLVPMSEVKNWLVSLPSKGEQMQIAGFLDSLDSTIALHQRKLEKLQELKKGYLQKMFC